MTNKLNKIDQEYLEDNCRLAEAPQADDVVRDLRNAAARLRRTPMPLSDVIPLLQRAADRIEFLQAKNTRLRDSMSKENDEISQTLGRALGYPRFCDDQKNFPGATDADGVCVGDHVAASLAAEAAARIESLQGF